MPRAGSETNPAAGRVVEAASPVAANGAVANAATASSVETEWDLEERAVPGLVLAQEKTNRDP